MRIAILGCGLMGSTLARAWARAGHQLLLGSRRPEALALLCGELGGQARALSYAEAVGPAEVLLLAVPLRAVPELAREVADQARGKPLLDACNPFLRRDGEHGRAAAQDDGGSGAWTARQFPEARVVKAFNTVFHRNLDQQAFRPGPRLGVPIAADDAEAIEVAATLVRDAGFEPVDIGPLCRSRSIDPSTVVWNSGFTAAEIRQALQLPEGPARP